MGRDRGQSKYWRRPSDFSPGLPHLGAYGDRFPNWDAIDFARRSAQVAYPGWTFAVTNTGPLSLEAFTGPDPKPTRKSLQRLGPGRIPEGRADEDRILGIILDAWWRRWTARVPGTPAPLVVSRRRKRGRR